MQERGVSDFEAPRGLPWYLIPPRQSAVITSRVSPLRRIVSRERLFFFSTAFRNYGDVFGLGPSGPPHPARPGWCERRRRGTLSPKGERDRV
jgi:hypothetical protein